MISAAILLSRTAVRGLSATGYDLVPGAEDEHGRALSASGHTPLTVSASVPPNAGQAPINLL